MKILKEYVPLNKRKKRGYTILASHPLDTAISPADAHSGVGSTFQKDRKREIILFIKNFGSYSGQIMIGIRYKDYYTLANLYPFTSKKGGMGLTKEIIEEREKRTDSSRWKLEFSTPFKLDDDGKIRHVYWTGGVLKAKFTLVKFDNTYAFRYSGEFVLSTKYGGTKPMKIQSGVLATSFEIDLVKAIAKKEK